MTKLKIDDGKQQHFSAQNANAVKEKINYKRRNEWYSWYSFPFQAHIQVVEKMQSKIVATILHIV